MLKESEQIFGGVDRKPRKRGKHIDETFSTNLRGEVLKQKKCQQKIHLSMVIDFFVIAGFG